MAQSIVFTAPRMRATQPAGTRQVAVWLLICCALVFAMVVVGGITRLTHSGLSMVEWQPIVGTIPPLDQAQWQDVFEKYQRTPQYQKVNRGMSLDEFKNIFWWEYIHRLLGRAIGLAFFIPLLYFVMRARVDSALAWRLLIIFVLGGLQGALGWYMVKSGLVDDPRVSQYRLTAHLGMAFLIYGAMLWTALGLLAPGSASDDPRRRRSYRRAVGLSVLIFVMALSGGLVAGIHAGKAYNTFPLMNGHVVPPEYLMLQPWYENFFSNMAAVQFDHRLIAWVLFFAIPLFWLGTRGLQLRPGARRACNLLPIALGLQIAIGIATLLLVVPVPLAAAHQAGALLLFTVAIWAAHELR